VRDYEYAVATRTWVLTEGAGQREEASITIDDGPNIRSELRVVADPNAGEVHRSRRKYQTFGWGEGLVEVREGSDSAPEITTYAYYSSGPSGYFGTVVPIQSIVHPDGLWEYHEPLDSSGRETAVLTSWGNQALTSSASLCRATYYNYAPVGSGDDGSIEPRTARTVVEKVLGHEVSRAYVVLKPGERQDIRCQTPGAAWNATDNLVTITKYYTTGSNANRIKSQKQPDGTLSLYQYVDNGTRTTTVAAGQPNGTDSAIVDGTQTVTVIDALGYLVSRTVTDIASGITIASQVHSNTDEFGRPRTTSFMDGSQEDSEFACCGLDTFTDRSGLTTQYWYDELGRLTASSQLGITVTNLLDASGNTLMTKRIGTDSSELVLGQSGYDLAGQRTHSVNAMGAITTFSKDTDPNGQTVRTTTYTNGSTRIEVYLRDGTMAQITGTAVHPVRYDYGIESEGGIQRLFVTETKLDHSGQPTSEAVKTYQDMLGRDYKVLYGDGSAGWSFYNAKGQLWKQVDPDGVATLYQYNAKGEPEYTIVDMDRDDVVDFSGMDRINRTVRTVLYNGTVSTTDGFKAAWRTCWTCC
ncbi:MAG: hypothetical protein ACO37D_09590, partial [Rhodothermales bacterium]